MMKKLFPAVFIIFAVTWAHATVYTYTTDTGYYFATSHEGKITMTTDLLSRGNIKNIPYTLGNWRGYELDHTDKNILFFRAYTHTTDENAKIYFIAVHGTVESTFHTAEVCYTNDNWLIEKRDFMSIPSGDKIFEMRYFTAHKEEWRHLLAYFFMWQDSRRLMQNGCVMFRIAVRMDSIDETKAKDYVKDFISQITHGSYAAEKPAAAQPPPDSAALILGNKKSPYYAVRSKAMKWLAGQMVPNDTVPTPAHDRRNLILSYELHTDADAYRYIYSKSSLYDNGVAVIAFTIERQYELASRIIDALMRMGGEEGELFFTFNTHNSWPNDEDNEGAIIRSGASAWAGQAIVFYLRARLTDDPHAVENNSELQHYLMYAKRIADRILTRRITDNKDARYGLITGGNGTYTLEYNKEISAVEENFIPGEVSWCSVEHNIDMYFFLRDLGIVSGETKYNEAAELLGRRLVEQCWNGPEGQFNRGQSQAQEDTVMALDCASWGALFLHSRGDTERVNQALTAIDRYAHTVDGKGAYKPYIRKLIFERYEAGAHYYPEKPKKTWDDVSMMWTEGALGAACAYVRAGKQKKAEIILNNVLLYQTKTGGITYGSLYIPHEFSTVPSVASSGWLIILTGILEQNPIAQLFWNSHD